METISLINTITNDNVVMRHFVLTFFVLLNRSSIIFYFLNFLRIQSFEDNLY